MNDKSFSKLTSLGLTHEQAYAVLREYSSEKELALIPDFREILDLCDEAGVQRPTRGVARLVVLKLTDESKTNHLSTDSDKKDIEDIKDREKLLFIICDESAKKSHRAKAAKKLSLTDFIISDKNRQKCRKNDTIKYWNHPNSASMKYWSKDQYPVVNPLVIFEDTTKVDLDPYAFPNKVQLVDHYNSESGADWTNVTLKRRALLVIARRDKSNVIAFEDPADVAVRLSADKLFGRWAVLESRTSNEELNKTIKLLSVKSSELRTNQRQPQDMVKPKQIAQQQKSVVGTPLRKDIALRNLIIALFNDSEIKSIASDLGVVNNINWNVCLKDKTLHFVQTCTSNGLVNSNKFWQAIVADRPNRINEIRPIANAYGHYV